MLKQGFILILTKSSSMIFVFLNSFFLLGYVNEINRGYYLTFVSIVAFSSMFELGVGTVIGQFLSHEAAHFSVEKSQILGNQYNFNRFFDILRSAIFWYLKALPVGFLVLFAAGYFIFSSKSSPMLDWIIPWIIFLLFTLGNIVLEVFFNAVYIIKSINKAQLVKFFALSTAYILSWILVLVSNRHSLIFLSFVPMVSFVLNFLLLRFLFPEIFFYSRKMHVSDFSWKNEVASVQKKMALSYISGGFVYSLFTPMLFYFQNPEIAGKFGLSFQLSNSFFSISNYVISILSLKMGENYSKKMYSEVKSLLVIFLVFTSIAFILQIIFLCVIGYTSYANRLIPIQYLLFLTCALALNSFIFCVATYVRSQKKEEFTLLSITIAILHTALLPIITFKYSYSGQILLFLSIFLFIGVPFTIFIFKENSKKVILST